MQVAQWKGIVKKSGFAQFYEEENKVYFKGSQTLPALVNFYTVSSNYLCFQKEKNILIILCHFARQKKVPLL